MGDEAAGPAAGTTQGMTARDGALEALRWNWGESYDIGEDDERGWWAKRRDGLGGLIIAADPSELRALIYADHDLKPVPRDFHSGEQ
jgi:hypothetical protein